MKWTYLRKGTLRLSVLLLILNILKWHLFSCSRNIVCCGSVPCVVGSCTGNVFLLRYTCTACSCTFAEAWGVNITSITVALPLWPGSNQTLLWPRLSSIYPTNSSCYTHLLFILCVLFFFSSQSYWNPCPTSWSMVATVQCPACRLAFSWRMRFTPKTSACGLYTSSDGCSSLKRSESMSNRMWVFRLWICLGHLLGVSLISPVFICMGGCSLNGLLVRNMQGAFDRWILIIWGKQEDMLMSDELWGKIYFAVFTFQLNCQTNVLWAPFDNGSALMVWFFHYFAEIASYWHFSTALSSDTGESWHWDATSQLSSPVRGMHSMCRVAPRSMARAYPVSAAQCHQPFLHRDDEGIHSGGHWIHLSGHCKCLILNWIFLLAWNKNAGVGFVMVT